MTPRDIIAHQIPGSSAETCFGIADDILEHLTAAVYVILPAAEAKPAAWLDDGTLRAGSERTAHRVVTDEQKRDMPNAVRSSFNVPLFCGMPAAEAQAIRDKALEEAATLVEAHDEVVNLKTGQRHLKERTEGNLVGLAYADAIRSLKGAKP